MRIIVAGAIAIIVSHVLSVGYARRAGIPPALWSATAGTGIVPRWVSVMGLAGWIMVALGVLALLF
jgi:hypothetical protein